jgi:hypothetical protein
MTPDTYDEATSLFPVLARYKKLIVSLLGTTVPLIIFLTSAPHPAPEVIAACLGWALTNFGVKQVTNEPQ